MGHELPRLRKQSALDGQEYSPVGPAKNHDLRVTIVTIIRTLGAEHSILLSTSYRSWIIWGSVAEGSESLSYSLRPVS